MNTKQIKIESLVTENLQVRVSLDESAIADYAEAMKDGAEFPPIVVFRDTARTESAPYLADGFHRVEAARRAGHDTIAAEVRDGTFDDALAFALRANDKHGVRRTKADMIHAMEIVWDKWNTLYRNEKRTTEDGLPSARQLMELCGVTFYMANNFTQKMRVIDSITPQSETPDAVTVTRAHLEERDASVRALLKDGKDRFGIDIPERLKPAFLSREPRQLVRELNRTYAELERRRMEGDIVFAPFVGFAMTHLDNLVNTIRHGMVYCVCRMCRGRGCGSCNNIGFQTKPQYDRNPSEFKAENR